MVGRNEDIEMSILRDTVKMAIKIAEGCESVEEVIKKLKEILDDKN